MPACVSDLSQLIAIPSVNGAAVDGAPFGKEIGRALDFMLDSARAQGLAARSLDGYAGEIVLPASDGPGSAEGYAAVLCHLDVVAAGDGWTSPPFALTRRDGLLIGRGVSDDKGPAIAALHALLAVRDTGLPRARELRLLLGTDEERGMAGIAHYFQHNPLPVMAFTPDAYYPVINAEKGLFRFSVRSARREAPAESPKHLAGIRRVTSGTALNLVPDRAEVELELFSGATAALRGVLLSVLDQFGEGHAGLSRDEGVYGITVAGVQAHSAYPQLGDNAAARALRLLSRLSGVLAVPRPLLALAELASGPPDGSALGIAGSDAESGSSTVSLSRLVWAEGQLEADFDARIHVSADQAAMERALTERVRAAGLSLVSLGALAPFFVPADHPVIGPLQEAYTSVTGVSAPLASTGGATYARSLRGSGVAFGAAMPGSDYRQHRPDEAVPEQDYLLHLQICAEALYRLGRA